jgi:hypothetical protein
MAHWSDEAACKGQTALFFGSDNTARYQAKKICATCPVKEPCLEEALELASCYDLHGVWAGTTRLARHKIVGFNQQIWVNFE